MNKIKYLNRLYLSFFLLGACLYYYLFLVLGIDQVFGLELSHVANEHDHNVYVSYLVRIRDGYYDIGLNNNFGIAFMYSILYFLLPYKFSLSFIAFIFNLLVIAFSFVVFSKIVRSNSEDGKYTYFFFFNLVLLYYSQLINKDALTILISLLAILKPPKFRYFYLVFLIVFAFLVRIQLGMILVFYLFYLVFDSRFWVLYSIFLVTSIAGGYISANELVISKETLGEGLSFRFFEINTLSPVLNLLIAPLRAIQFYFSMGLSFFPFSSGALDLSRLLLIPVLVLLILNIKNLFSALRIAIVNKHSPFRDFFGFLFIFTFTWIMNPSINDRYATLVLPVVLVILATYKGNKRKC